jgi:alkylation response protein AidB-like acyl-CoA dehydrogenase
MIPTVPESWPDPDSSALPPEAFEAIADADGPADEAGTWPDDLWRRVVALGATRWSLPESSGGGRVEVLHRYGRLAEASLTAAFILTQHDAAVRRLAAASGPGLAAAEGWIEAVRQGRCFPTVGISQLTTSRRHGARALAAVAEPDGGFRLDGVMPWVTAACRADLLVTGAVLDDGQQLLIAIPTGRAGLSVRPPFPLAALQASCTSEVACEGVRVSRAEILAGPSHDVMAIPGLAGTGGLETTALALGQARAALAALAGETTRRDDLEEPLDALQESWGALAAHLLASARGEAGAPPPALLRSQANALVLRATQAYLTARKGTGFLRTEPAQRWARQALFFLVWSCPTPVARAAIRDLAGLCDS